jgi:hypothetical protein
MTKKTGTYVGPPDLHDAVIVRAAREGAVARVELRSCEGRAITLQFSGVSEFLCRGELASHMIYALWETMGANASRRFVFVPWEDDEKPKLEIVARGLAEVPPAIGD